MRSHVDKDTHIRHYSAVSFETAKEEEKGRGKKKEEKETG